MAIGDSYAVMNSTSGMVETWVKWDGISWDGKTVLAGSDGKPAILTAITSANAASLQPQLGWNSGTTTA